MKSLLFYITLLLIVFSSNKRIKRVPFNQESVIDTVKKILDTVIVEPKDSAKKQSYSSVRSACMAAFMSKKDSFKQSFSNLHEKFAKQTLGKFDPNIFKSEIWDKFQELTVKIGGIDKKCFSELEVNFNVKDSDKNFIESQIATTIGGDTKNVSSLDDKASRNADNLVTGVLATRRISKNFNGDTFTKIAKSQTK